MSIRPLQDRVVVRRKEQETTTASGIVLTSSAQEKPNEGEVVAVGKGRVKSDGEIQPMDVKVGDIVLFGQYAGSAVKIDGEDLLIMSEDDILGVLA